jgi:hypothetical protein
MWRNLKFLFLKFPLILIYYFLTALDQSSWISRLTVHLNCKLSCLWVNLQTLLTGKPGHYLPGLSASSLGWSISHLPEARPSLVFLLSLLLALDICSLFPLPGLSVNVVPFYSCLSLSNHSGFSKSITLSTIPGHSLTSCALPHLTTLFSLPVLIYL